jgi:hypothetical protein
MDVYPESNSTNLMTSRSSSFFKNFSEMSDNGALSPNKRKRTTSISINKMLARLKMGINTFNNGMPNSFHRNLIDQMNQLNDAKKDKESAQINSLDSYSREELITVKFINKIFYLFFT